MKSRASFMIRVAFIAMFFMGVFAGAATNAGVSAADRHRDHCKKECEDRYNHRKHECGRHHNGRERHQCEEEAKRDRDQCKDRCR